MTITSAGEFYASIAPIYFQYRPKYPGGLFSFLRTMAPSGRQAWDVGTGNGQAAVGLAEQFEEVLATDICPKQLLNTHPHPRVVYRAAAAEGCPLDDGTVDLVTAAQSYHWFDHERFLAEVRRVTRPGGVLAVWCYSVPRVEGAINTLIDGLYHDPHLVPLFPPGRRHVDDGYARLPLPFPEIPCPAFAATEVCDWSWFRGYLHTWQAVQEAKSHPAANAALADHMSRLATAWGPPEARREVRWALRLRACQRPCAEEGTSGLGGCDRPDRTGL